MTTTRQQGYYWVTTMGSREIGYWNNNHWLLCGLGIEIWEDSVTDINENRIVETT